MKILKLTMEAFGSFAEKTEIEFSNLGSKGVVLISGKTGSGKTTIFDAVSFSLFGSASGGYREKHLNSLVCQYKTPEAKPSVTLDFIVKGKNYRVVRTLPYDRPNKKNIGKTVAEDKTACLFLPDGETVTKWEDVTEKIEDILGMNKDQFSHIAMIAQGEFVRLVNATTQQRIKILKGIFNTSLYEKMGEHLKRLETSLLNSIHTDECRAKDHIKNIDFNVLEADEEDFGVPLILNETNKESLRLLEERNRTVYIKCNSFEAKIKNLENKKANISLRLSKEREKKKQKEDLEAKKTELENISVKLSEKQNLVHNLKDREETIQKKTETLTLLKNQIHYYKEMEESESELKIKKQKLNELTSSIKIKEAKLNDGKTRLKKIRETIKTIHDQKDACLMLQTEIGSLSSRKLVFNKATEVIYSFFNTNNQILELQHRLKQQQRYHIEIERNYFRDRKSFFQNQAVILAQNLKEGDACPVCGSHHHPKLAEINKDIVSANTLESSEKKYNDSKNQIKSLETHITFNYKAGKSYMENINKYICEIEGEASVFIKKIEEVFSNFIKENYAGVAYSESELNQLLKKLSDHTDSTLSSKKTEFDVLKDKIDREKELINELNREETCAKEFESSITDLRYQEEKTKSKIKELEIFIKTHGEDLPYSTFEDAYNALDELNNAVSEYNSQTKRLNLEIGELEVKKGSLEGNIEILKDILSNHAPEEEEYLEDEYIRINEEIDIYRNSSEKLNIIYNKNKTAIEVLNEVNENYFRLREKYESITQLVQVAAGKVPKKEKISLETYVLQRYFANVVAMANKRLGPMSGNAYRLKISEHTDKRGNRGLDLNIYDKIWGKERPTGTLSGGETFIVALSLAQGLAELIQSQIGGVEINSIFIDEGFGSLDEDSLPVALKLLENLSEHNTQVCIISHVASLKDRIDKQILVTKENNSSKIGLLF